MRIVADNLNPTNPVVARAMQQEDTVAVSQLARVLSRAGASHIDINPGYLGKKRLDRIEFMVRAVESSTEARLVLDSPSADVLAKGLAACARTPVISALTLEPAKLERILPLAVESGADLVVLLLDEKSTPPSDSSAKLSLAVELFTAAISAGLTPDRLIFDPVLPSLGWPDALSHLAASIETVRLLKTGMVLGEPVRTMAGLSNLRSGKRKEIPVEVETMALAALLGAGLDFALLDVTNPAIMAALRMVGPMVP